MEAVPENLYSKLMIPRVRRSEQSSEDILEAERAEELLAYLSRYEYASIHHVLLALLWETGMRMGAVFSLDLTDVDFDEERVELVHRPDQGTTLKNGTSGERLIALSTELTETLEDHVEAIRHDVIDDYGREPLLTTEYGRMRRSTIRRKINQVTAPCYVNDPCPDCEQGTDKKCPEAVSPHAIRRGSITHFLIWPAIYRGDLEIAVETPDETLTADVKSVPAIRPFVEAYDERTTDAQTLVDPGDVAGLDIPVDLPPRADGTETPDGSVRLSARLASPADDDTYMNNAALFRGAGMVVKYYDQSRVAYGDRNFFGVLAAGEARSERSPSDNDREIDRFLRFAEPPEHDEWESTENLREQYQRGFRTALDDMFGTLRDGLRHLISKGSSADTLSDNVLNRFPIHGSGNPRSTTSPADPVFEIDSSSHYNGDAWTISGRVEVLPEEFKGWNADISLTGVGEDRSRYDDIPIDHLEIEQAGVTVSYDEGRAHLVADENVREISFTGRSRSDGNADLVHGDVGATQLEILAELETPEED